MGFARMRDCAISLALLAAAGLARAQDYPPGQASAPDTGRAFAVAPSSLITDQYYGIAHGGGGLAVTGVSFSGGLANFTLTVNIAPWAARSSEGIFYAEIWVEGSSGGGWPGDIEGYSGVYAVNVNSGTPPGGGWSWSKQCQAVAPGTQFRAFGYCYMYNQGGGRQGEYALYSWTAPVAVPSPVPMTPPTSADSTATFGVAWTPSVSGGEGTGAYLFCVGGQTNFATLSTPWVPGAAGTYGFWVGQMPDGTNSGNVVDPRIGEMEVNPVPYSLTVNPAPLNQVTSANAAITVGQSWTPDYSGGTPGAGPFVFAVWGQTNFGYSPTSLTGSWTPSAAGIYNFNVGQQTGGPNYTGNATDPNVGPMEVNPVPYIVTVSKASQGVGSADAALVYGQSFTPAYFQLGGSGSGLFQFCIVNRTTFDGGATLDTGTSDPARGGAWESSWPSPPAGTYQFMVAEDGNSAFNPANPGTNYTLTVNPADPPAVAVSPSSASVATGASVEFTAGNGLNGYAWSVSPAGPLGISGNGAGQTISFPSPGSYTVSVYSPAGGDYMISNTAYAMISVATPQYTLTTGAVGDGSVTPGGTYPANSVLSIFAFPGASASFTGWTGSLSSQSNPLSVTLTGDLTLYGNFYSLQPQTIDFAPPRSADYPGPPLGLAATASSGLPVDFSVVSGPGRIAGSQLFLTGTGPVAVQASQGGNELWLPAESVTAAINVSAPPSIARIRFHTAGHDAAVSTPDSGSGSSSLWTDPTGLQASPWPSFGSPAAAVPGPSNMRLPAVPPAPPLSP
jgi:hypothetical protein